MSNSPDRRAAQKARTRARIRAAAQDLFADRGFDAVTIVELAATAGVSVQTVFNHFESKEELFFADRATWVEGPSLAVRNRDRHEEPTTALRRHLVGSVADYVRATSEPHTRRMIEVLESTPALLTYELNLHETTVALLAAELRRAWAADGVADPASAAVLPQITAAVWMAGVRSIVLGMRSSPPAPDDKHSVHLAAALTERVLGEMERSVFAATGSAPLVARAS